VEYKLISNSAAQKLFEERPSKGDNTRSRADFMNCIGVDCERGKGGACP